MIENNIIHVHVIIFVYLKDIAKNDGIYRIRIPIRETGDGTVYVSTFTKAVSCLPYRSFKFYIYIFLTE